MFLIKTCVGPSIIHGNGVFACEEVPAGETIWRFCPPFDQVISDEQIQDAPKAVQDFLDTYAYPATDLGGQIVLSGDNAKFLNHSSDPNTEERPFASVARRAIAIGDEITCDYGAFCVGGTSFDDTFESERRDEGSKASGPPARLPHDDLYTRLQSSPNGVGVFAIRDIPPGTVLFAGDIGETTRVPVQEVEQIRDVEIKRMYLDFCPVVDGAFVAPKNFNQITMGWYLNHSDDGNVVSDENLRFTARHFIATGKELRSDYATYSEHAPSFIAAWKADRVKPRS